MRKKLPAPPVHGSDFAIGPSWGWWMIGADARAAMVESWMREPLWSHEYAITP